MLDSIIFEKLGLPAAAIVTHPFRATCEAMAELQSMPGYRFVQVEHPITSLSLDELRGRARAAAPYVEALLVAGVAWPQPSEVHEEPGADDGLVALVEDLAADVRADGADLYAQWAGRSRIRFELSIPDQACAECVMPAAHLLPIFERRAAQHLGAGLTVELIDPREETTS